MVHYIKLVITGSGFILGPEMGEFRVPIEFGGKPGPKGENRVP
jgi:hypothetical protein